MNFTLKQISAFEKIRSMSDLCCGEVSNYSVLSGQRVNYQICAWTDTYCNATVSVESPLAEYIKLYSVKKVIMDKPVTENVDRESEDYLSYEPGLMPDLLIPMEEQGFKTFIKDEIDNLWVRADIPADMPAGNYPVTIHYQLGNDTNDTSIVVSAHYSTTMELEVLAEQLAEQQLVYTRWFYTDCIADYHKVSVYSEEHWSLIEKYIKAAVDSGINMILVPIHTPPLDTAIGTTRTCVQLVDIEKIGDSYSFDFEKFHRFIGICKACGVKYFEMAHLFSQWGSKYAPNIMVTEGGVKDYLFGWHVEADSELYINFLKQYVAAIGEQLAREGISERTYFHISDEPTLENMETYKKASDIIRPLLKGARTMDALTQVEFYDEGLVECPITAVDHIAPFLKKKIPNQWTYYCCVQLHKVTNNLMANPSYRTRIGGFQMYRHDIKGFLHWGYNFYNAQVSLYPIDPYLTTSADKAFPSGDPFIVYPGRDTVYGSLRGEVFFEALQDMRICLTLEKYMGRKAVEKMIDDAAGYTLTFDHYPKGNAYPEKLRADMISMIKSYK